MNAQAAVRYGTILAISPYLLLKIAWVSGATIGIADPGRADDTTLLVINVLTLLMDAVALGVVLALTQRWGLRLPAPLVLLPSWVGTGLLVPIVIAAPLVAAIETWYREPAPVSTGFLEPWVTPTVYTSFVAQGLGLVLAFVLYVRARWSRLLTLSTDARVLGPTQGVYATVTWLAVALVSSIAVLRLTWSVADVAGRPRLITDGGVSQQVVSAVFGVVAIAAAIGLLALVRRWGPDTPAWLPLGLTWLGSGALWAWGSWGMLLRLAGGASSSDAIGGAGLLPAIELGQVLGGLLMALVGALVAVELAAAQRSVEPATRA